MGQPSIRYLRNTEINKISWDRCINQSVNGTMLAYSWYLDIVAPGWDALVLEDYLAVFPLTWHKKMGMQLLTQPTYARQLGIFTGVFLDPALVMAFLKRIPSKYRYINVNLNPYNKVSGKSFSIHYQANQQLDLIQDYHSIKSRYKKDLHELLGKAAKLNYQVMKHVNLRDLLLLKKEAAHKPANLEQLNILRRIIPFALSHGLGETYGTYDEKNQLLAVTFVLHSHQNALCLLAFSNSKERDTISLATAFDFFIREFSSKPITLVFPNELNNVTHNLLPMFGTQSVKFPVIELNRFPWVLKYLNHSS